MDYFEIVVHPTTVPYFCLNLKLDPAGHHVISISATSVALFHVSSVTSEAILLEYDFLKCITNLK